jgi:hypothetical protein
VKDAGVKNPGSNVLPMQDIKKDSIVKFTNKAKAANINMNLIMQ